MSYEMNEPFFGSRVGYTTKEALLQLRNDISLVLADYKKRSQLKDSTLLLKEVTSISSENVLVSGVTYLLTALYALILTVVYSSYDSVQVDVSILLEAVLLWVMLLVNFFVALNENILRKAEIPRRIKHVLAALKEAAEKCDWQENHYPHLCAPYSPCVTLQWTYRDGAIVNLPWALLVRGDIVVLRPGQEVPGLCESFEPGGPTLAAGQIFQQQSQGKETFTKPRMTSPHKNKLYRMSETPYLANVSLALEQATKRPVTVHNKQRYLCTVKLMEGMTMPLAIALVLIASFLRHLFYLPGTTHWVEIYFLQTITATLPLLQLVFPIAWVALNCYGMARLKRILECKKKFTRAKSCSISEEVNDPLLQAFSESNLKVEDLKSIWRTFYRIVVGKENMVTRTSNIVHVLGSLTALSCVDKKGILSWPNPTAEKVFLLRNSGTLSRSSSSSKTSFIGSMDQLSQSGTPDQVDGNKHYDNSAHINPSTVIEVLDLTHDQNAPFHVEFDDQAWHTHLARLKPLGLAARLNTCAPSARRRYADFCAHLTCEAHLTEDLVPVTNRRCLCELAKLIGFQDEATQVYNIQDNLATFRHLQADTIRRDTRFARSLHLNTRVKVPLPHMLGVIVKDPAGQLQLLSQGTADIILDSCMDYWNGHDLCPLSPSDRKKILDFYQRSSLTAYCTAFSYKPLNRGISNALASQYLELPADCKQVYSSQATHWMEPRMPLGGNFHSTDSLLFSDVREDDVKDVEGYFDLQCNQVFIGMVTMQYQAQSDMVELIERLERACVRFVHFSKENELRSRVFSEKMGLESGWNCHISLLSQTQSNPASPVLSQNVTAPSCMETSMLSAEIAFSNSGPGSNVDASKDERNFHGEENLIYSNRTSSKMAASKTLSSSAPGAINLDHPTVKFENETKRIRHSITTHNSGKTDTATQEMAESESEDSLLQGWCADEAEADTTPPDGCRSLSCLTDSTEHSAPVNFDMRNRAKLPRGIENIRPHIEQVDNVPLLVSLFTDCTASSARRMIEIMQDYDEVVCVMGSAANKDNMEIFMQADASVAVEPLYPVLCQRMPAYQVPGSAVGPVDLARALNSVPCSISMIRDADISLFSMITMSRHFMMCLWNVTQFWMCCLISITLLQVLSLLCFMPLALSTGNALWLSLLVVPALSAALTFVPPDPAVMQRAAGKHQTQLNMEALIFVTWCYGLKFIPAMLSTLCSYAFTLRSFCEQISAATNITGCCMVYPVNADNVTVMDLSQYSWHGWGDIYYDGYLFAQHINLAMVTIHLVVISMSFIHRDLSIWQKCFWTNRVWCSTVIFLLVFQAIYTGVVLSGSYTGSLPCKDWSCGVRFHLSWPLLIAFLVSPTIVFLLNEFIKWQEIRANLRYQRRARLDFGTKLGMNSPF